MTTDMNTEQERADFEAWWEKEGQYCRAGGGEYEKTFAYRAYQAGRAVLQSPEIQALRKDAARLDKLEADYFEPVEGGIRKHIDADMEQQT